MTENIRQMKAEDPCICGSKNEWKKCCGRCLEEKEGYTALFQRDKRTKTVRFFLCKVMEDEAYDIEGEIPVFTDRAQALGLNERLDFQYQVVGMSEESWQRFQKDGNKYVVISDAVA